MAATRRSRYSTSVTRAPCVVRIFSRRRPPSLWTRPKVTVVARAQPLSSSTTTRCPLFALNDTIPRNHLSPFPFLLAFTNRPVIAVCCPYGSQSHSPGTPFSVLLSDSGSSAGTPGWSRMPTRRIIRFGLSRGAHHRGGGLIEGRQMLRH